MESEKRPSCMRMMKAVTKPYRPWVPGRASRTIALPNLLGSSLITGVAAFATIITPLQEPKPVIKRARTAPRSAMFVPEKKFVRKVVKKPGSDAFLTRSARVTDTVESSILFFPFRKAFLFLFYDVVFFGRTQRVEGYSALVIELAEEFYVLQTCGMHESAEKGYREVECRTDDEHEHEEDDAGRSRSRYRAEQVHHVCDDRARKAERHDT